MITLIAGKQGAGKSLHSVRLSDNHLKKVNKFVYSNVYIEDCYMLPLNWYDFKYEDDSLLILDEAQLEYNCRDYSSKDKHEINKKILSYLTMCRHYNIEIVFITQSISRLDSQIRELATDIYRFSKTYKILYFSIKEIRFKKLPIFQKGWYFDDIAMLDRFLNCTTSNYEDFGRKFFKFVNPKILKKYDTHIKDDKYLNKELASKIKWTKEKIEGGFSVA